METFARPEDTDVPERDWERLGDRVGIWIALLAAGFTIGTFVFGVLLR